MRRIEFVLTMPNVGSWDGRWKYGEDRRFALVRVVTDKVAKKLLGDQPEASWGYHWDDGWSALVSARLTKSGERAKKSDGFCGYEWMVDSIVEQGKIEYSRK